MPEPLSQLFIGGESGEFTFLGDIKYFKLKIAKALGVPSMFADEQGDVAVLEPEEPEAAPDDAGIADESVVIEEDDKKAPDGTTKWPAFIVNIDNLYRANRAHVFALHGNVNDYPDNTGIRGDLGMTLFTRYDKFWLTEKVSQEVQNTGKKVNVKAPRATNVAARFTVPDGLVFATTGSFQAFADIVRKDPRYAEAKDEQLQPKDLPGTLILLNDYFKLSAMRFSQNQPLRTKLADKSLKTGARAAVTKELAERPEINLTVMFYDAKMCFPAGQVSTLTMDRTPIAYVENWALNGAIAPRNKIILIAQRLQDLQESLRSGDSRVAAIRVKRPTLEERKEWLEGFSSYIKIKPALINGAARTSLTLAEDLTWDILANNTAGMSRVQIEGVFMESWLEDVPVDLPMIADHKKKSLAAEYGDILDIRQPIPTTLCPETKGKPEEQQRAAVWNLLGGHDLLKQYAEQWVMEPMLLGDRRRTTRGFLLVGPAGTGKTWYGELLAAVCRINFVYVNFSKLYGGIVGESLHADEEVYYCNSNGRHVERKTMKEAYKSGNLPYTFTYTKNGGFQRKRVTGIVRHERQEDFYVVKTKRGREVVVTEGHSVFTRKRRSYKACSDRGPESSGWLTETSVKDLKPGVEIAIAGGLWSPNLSAGCQDTVNAKFGKFNISNELAELGGVWLAEGSYNNGRVRLSVNRKEHEIVALAKSFGPVTEFQEDGTECLELTINDWSAAACLHGLGFDVKTSSHSKRIPAWVWGMSDEKVGRLLRGYFSGDGGVSGHSIECSTVSKKLADDIVFLLSRFNIVASIRPRKGSDERLIKGHRTVAAPGFRINISKVSELAAFQKYIGFMQDDKNAQLKALVDSYPEEVQRRGRDKARYSVFWDKVESIRKLESDDPYSYDISVEDTEKFICSGVVVHNTERNTERLYEAIEAMAPCIVFADEIDSAFSSGRQSAGDSGVQARVFNRTMRWLSDDARWGKVVVLAATNRPDLLDEAFIRAGRFDDVIPALPPHPSDAKGRKSLLAAVCKKTGVRVLKSLVETLKTADNGLGRLIFSPRVWTGAEVERLVKMAFGNAAQRVSRAAKEQAAAKKLPRRETLEFLRTETKNPLIELDDWNHAMDSYRPNTRQAETQIDLALGYSNNDDYCPAEWRSRLDAAREKTANTVESAANYNGAAGAYERD